MPIGDYWDTFWTQPYVPTEVEFVEYTYDDKGRVIRTKRWTVPHRTGWIVGTATTINVNDNPAMDEERGLPQQ